jgi:hypothetical protein
MPCHLHSHRFYFTNSADPIAGDTTKPAGYIFFALDAKTGQERWRYRAKAPCIRKHSDPTATQAGWERRCSQNSPFFVPTYSKIAAENSKKIA